MGVVYVLTQERFNTLLEETNIRVDTLFVDEAQEIQNNRGVMLQSTIENSLAKFPKINLFFASPLIKNPSYFNHLFKGDLEKHFLEKVPPVSQNIFFVSSAKDNTSSVEISIYRNEEIIHIDDYKIDFDFVGEQRVIAFAEVVSNGQDFTLVYCDGSAQAEKRALALASSASFKPPKYLDQRIKNLIEYIEEDVHGDYSLITCLKKQIAFHYGKMPSTIRSEIERLSSEGVLKVVFCTSTLLQGVLVGQAD